STIFVDNLPPPAKIFSPPNSKSVSNYEKAWFLVKKNITNILITRIIYNFARQIRKNTHEET
ncbi:MAG: hypothetical protein IK144_07280, partial [Bacteroidaceae bacterium]|nr:hypothetical protein [Bacteroidaceae bacterium]